jgi:hypothetical protein
VKRSTVVAASLTAAVSVLPLSGCSLFQRAPSESITSGPTAAASGSASSVHTSPAPATAAIPSDAPVPPTVPGYAMAPAPTTVLRKFQGVAGKFNGVYSGLTVRTVTKGQTATGTLVLLGLHPELVGNTTVERGLLPGMLKGMSGQGARTSKQTVAGQDVAVATTKTTNIVAWYRSGTVVLVLGSGTDPTTTLAFAKAYVAAR